MAHLQSQSKFLCGYGFACFLVLLGFAASGAEATGAPAALPQAPTLVSIAITPANATITIGVVQAFTATGTFDDQSVKDITANAIWSSSVPSVAKISGAGRITPVQPGKTIITAAYGAVSGATALTVVAPTAP